MDLSYGEGAETFRREVRSFLKGAWQPGERRKDELKAFIRDFRTKATDAGYLYRAIPKQYGGSEQPARNADATASPRQQSRGRIRAELI